MVLALVYGRKGTSFSCEPGGCVSTGASVDVTAWAGDSGLKSLFISSIVYVLRWVFAVTEISTILIQDIYF